MRKSNTATGRKEAASHLQRGSLLALAVASTLALAGTVQAGEAPGASALEEIIVTAERRATTEGTTAISMNVLSAEDLASTGTKNIADIQTSTPNVTINNPGGFNSINIRGIGNSAIQPSIAVGVAVLQDGLLNAETITLSNQFLDLGTIEVLRGPQGTFIGTSSTGGAIRLNSVKPSLTAGITGFVEGKSRAPSICRYLTPGPRASPSTPSAATATSTAGAPSSAPIPAIPSSVRARSTT